MRSAIVLSLSSLLVLTVWGESTVAAQEPEIQVEAAVARDVVDRMPVDTASTFPADVERLWLWTRVRGAAGTTIHHVWIHDGNEVGDVPLAIGGSPWRTYSNKRIPEDWTGDWRVEVRDADGNVLETVSFTVGGSGP